jgi:hypothetical protein
MKSKKINISSVLVNLYTSCSYIIIQKIIVNVTIKDAIIIWK